MIQLRRPGKFLWETGKFLQETGKFLWETEKFPRKTGNFLMGVRVFPRKVDFILDLMKMMTNLRLDAGVMALIQRRVLWSKVQILLLNISWPTFLLVTVWRMLCYQFRR